MIDIGKDSDAGRDWGQEEKGRTEDEMAGWHHWLDGCESEWTLGVGDGQGGLVCCYSCGHKESDTTERLIWYAQRIVEAANSEILKAGHRLETQTGAGPIVLGQNVSFHWWVEAHPYYQGLFPLFEINWLHLLTHTYKVYPQQHLDEHLIE